MTTEINPKAVEALATELSGQATKYSFLDKLFFEFALPLFDMFGLSTESQMIQKNFYDHIQHTITIFDQCSNLAKTDEGVSDKDIAKVKNALAKTEKRTGEILAHYYEGNSADLKKAANKVASYVIQRELGQEDSKFFDYIEKRHLFLF
jgi:hypothetical protein